MQRRRLFSSAASSSVPRRQFLVGSLAGFARGWHADRHWMGCEPPFPPVRVITRAPKHHRFAYYDKLQFDPDGSRFIALHRWRYPNGSRLTRLVTTRPDGSDVRIVIPNGYPTKRISLKKPRYDSSHSKK